MCGGTQLRVLDVERPAGLSPRVRGNPPGRNSALAPAGSIPACAGEPDGHPHAADAGRVYPRVCGGTAQQPALRRGREGLSPRVRGNQPGAHPLRPFPGSIPACAGEPIVPAGEKPRIAVYPRVCGGTLRWCAAGDADKGLSPRVRGNRGCCPCLLCPRGSIPACAGEPHLLISPVKHFGVYPRVCGGTSFSRVSVPSSEGLSPRVRGNPARAVPVLTGTGSIPACAGEPRLIRPR